MVSFMISLSSRKTQICEVNIMLKIGDFSKLSQISIRMLRHYDDLGLLPRLQKSINSAKKETPNGVSFLIFKIF